MNLATRVYRAEVPTNIAFLKYWGKDNKEYQWPANDSLSMTLSELKTITIAQAVGKGSNHRVTINNLKEQIDSSKAVHFLQMLQKKLLFKEELEIVSGNSFPTGCGIASSASGFAALTIAALGAWTQSTSLEALVGYGYSLETIAALARLGSGSACRSFWSGFVLWERTDDLLTQNVSQVFPPEHLELHDTIVIFNPHPKDLPSTLGHDLAPTSPFFTIRRPAMIERRQMITQAIQDKNIKMLGYLIEQDALELHTMIMTSQPAFAFIDQDIAQFLAQVRELRIQEGLDVYFTIDCGPNIHLIHTKKDKSRLHEWLKHRNLFFYHDVTGGGPMLF